jgi:hypothetical protein
LHWPINTSNNKIKIVKQRTSLISPSSACTKTS